MRRVLHRTSKKAGLPPGTPVYVGKHRTGEIKITVINYDRESFDIIHDATLDDCSRFKDLPAHTWINIDGLHDIKAIETVGRLFGIHPLILEDIVNTDHRPKIDISDDSVFIILKTHTLLQETVLSSAQFSLILKQDLVLTFQEEDRGVLDGVRQRLKSNKGLIRKSGSDYLAYAIIDDILDNYYSVLEYVGEEIETNEEQLIERPSPDIFQSIHDLKKQMIFLRKAIWPLREIIGSLERERPPLIQETTYIYLRDLYDHIFQIIDTVETFRDMISGMLEIYLSSISNRMNEIMKTLTIFASIFIPLTFVTGIYGMNFNTEKSIFNMPELNWAYGYPFILGIMAVIGIGMFIFFRRKKWF
jgi:magnesium transporter